MSTQIFETDQIVLLPRPTGVSNDEIGEMYEQDGSSVFRGFFFAMVFNLLLLLTGAAGWELWRIIR